MDTENPEITPAVVPMERLGVPAQLDGHDGGNRAAPEECQLSASTDAQAIAAWLARKIEQPATFDSYRREAERLFLWAIHAAGRPLSSLTHEDLLAYKRFLADPQPAQTWVMTGAKFPRSDARWRPFAGPLSPASQRHAVGVIDSLFSWLVDAGYLRRNPLTLSRARQVKSKPRVTRVLDDLLWAEVQAAIDAMPRITERDQKRQARARWLFALLFLCGLRISEVCESTTTAFKTTRDQHGNLLWWLEVVGKGRVTRAIPISDELMAEFAHYRRTAGLDPLPQAGENLPLVMPIRAGEAKIGRAALHNFIKSVFNLAARRLEQRGPEWAGEAARLRLASAHWLRHTAGSNMARHMDMVTVRDNLGHKSINTTSIYLHSEDERRHQQTVGNHRLARSSTGPGEN